MADQKNLWVSDQNQPKPPVSNHPKYYELLVDGSEIRRSPVDMEIFIAIFSWGKSLQDFVFFKPYLRCDLEDSGAPISREIIFPPSSLAPPISQPRYFRRQKGGSPFCYQKKIPTFFLPRNSKGIPLARPLHLAATQLTVKGILHPPKKLTWPWKKQPFEDVLDNFPASHLSVLERYSPVKNNI